MKDFILTIIIAVFAFNANAQTNPKKVSSNKVITKQVVEIACGECQFKMKGKDCELAIRVDGKPYFIDGKNIDDFGDAHGEHGFCNAVSKAEVTGEIVNNRFKASNITYCKQTNNDQFLIAKLAFRNLFVESNCNG